MRMPFQGIVDGVPALDRKRLDVSGKTPRRFGQNNRTFQEKRLGVFLESFRLYEE